MSNAELYLNTLVVPKTETEFKRYLQQDQSLCKTDIYAF
jgi:hypothetical protein